MQMLQLSITLKKKVAFIWITIPCENGTGSCTYNDLCGMMPIPNPCPASFKTYSIPCKCPINSGSYNLPTSPAFTFGSSSIPSWLASGDYKLNIKVNDKTGTEVLCLDIDLTLKDNDL